MRNAGRTPSSPREPIVLVTGAAGGIGSAVCEAVTRAGWRPIGLDQRPGEHVEVVSDLSDMALVHSQLEPLIGPTPTSVFGLVNAAGYGFEEPFLQSTDESWGRVIEANLMTTVRMCRLTIPWLQAAAGNRSIVNFGSQAGKSGGITIGAQYSAAKAAVMCLTKSLAGAFGPEGIRVNAVAPGIVETPFLDEVPAVRQMAPRIPLRRLGAPSDVADAVVYLLSPQASYITGEIVDINGGLLMD
ncbi:MAG: SDR family oxidoreductase [Actinomycetota bacterium]|nr:SDR family oxidoreductase [Actinomycetota bacterium]